MPTTSVAARPWWRSALRGGTIALGVPVVGGLGLMLLGGDLAVGGHWIAFAAILGSPAFFALGAIGGIVAHRLSQPPHTPAAMHREEDGRRAVAVWTTLGVLAGYGASDLTSFRWPVIGGALIGLALVPVWIWIGIAGARRTFLLRGRARASARAVIAGAAAYVVARLPLMFIAVPQGLTRSVLTTVLIGIPVGATVVAYFAFVAAGQRSKPPA